jgi:PIG-X / PBN1
MRMKIATFPFLAALLTLHALAVLADDGDEHLCGYNPTTDQPPPADSDPLAQAFALFCDGDCPSTAALTASGSVTLIGEGFHRKLMYALQLRLPATPAPHSPAACELLLLQPIPKDAFVNIYDLNNIAALKRGPAVQQFGAVDLENMAPDAGEAVLAIHPSVQSGQHEAETVGVVRFGMAVHGRYPKAVYPVNRTMWRDIVLSPMVEFDIAAPRILVRWV